MQDKSILQFCSKINFGDNYKKTNILGALFYYSQILEMKAQVADAFIAKFQLTPEEMNLLRGTREGPITEVI